jgi:hypothetical protein
MVEDPYAELRLELLEQALEDAKNETQATVFADAAGLDALEGDEEPGLPDPTLYYRLDGTVTLKRTRFLHLGLNLQLREAVWEEEIPVLDKENPVLDKQIPVLDEADEPEFAQPVPSSFLVHDLQQSRQVKTGRMEYFDGPVLSVLAYITSVRVDDELPP